MLVLGLMIVKKVKNTIDEYPHRMLIFIIIVFFINCIRGAALIIERSMIYVDDNNYSLIDLLIFNAIEIIPILVFLIAMKISLSYKFNSNQRYCIESSSMSGSFMFLMK